MSRTARLFRNGRSQAVRLPADLRFQGSEVFIRQDKSTGDVILSNRPDSWDDFFQLRCETDIPGEFLADRRDEIPQTRETL